MIIKISNPDIGQNQKTYLATDISTGDTSLTVQNNQGFTANDYIVVGNMGTEQAEIRKIASVSGHTTIVVDAIDFPHSIDTPITFIKYNRIAAYYSTSKGGTYYALAASPYDITVDQEFTEIEDVNGTSSTWYQIRFYNGSAYSDYSDPIQGVGYTDDSVRAIMDRIYIIGNDPEHKALNEDDMIVILNDGYRKLVSRVMKDNHKFYLKGGYVDVVNSYDTGTISITDGSATVTGVGTTWTSAMVGRSIQFGNEGYSYEILARVSGTQLTLSQNYNGSGSNLSNSTYIIYRDKYDIYDDSDDTIVDDLKKIEMVVDEDGGEIMPFDMHRNPNGYYLERSGDNFQFCLNYVTDTTLAGGRWTIWYLYQPPKLDSMADVPELPLGFDSVLQAYGLQRLYERMGDSTKARIYENQFIQDANSMIRYGSHRTNKPKSFRLPSRHSSKVEEEPLDSWTTD